MPRYLFKWKKTVEVLGCVGEGISPKEARADAHRKIETAMRGNYTPYVAHWRGVTMILYCDLGHYCYAIVRPEYIRDGKVGHLSCSMEGEDRDIAIQNMLTHLAQVGWKHSDGATVPPILANYSREVQNDFLYWTGFQLAYAHYKKKNPNLNDNHWHRWACENAKDFYTPIPRTEDQCPQP